MIAPFSYWTKTIKLFAHKLLNKMDACYIIGPGDCEELRFSLRSVERFLNFRSVVVCGHDPGILSSKVTFIPNMPSEKTTGYDKAWNIMQNIKALCEDDRVSENFIFLNDDYIFVWEYRNFEYWHKGWLDDTMELVGSGDYYRHLLATKMALLDKGHNTINFDVHYPIIYNKKLLLDVINEYDWTVPDSYVMKSLYANTLGIPGRYRKDCKVYNSVKDWQSFLVGKNMFSLGDNGFDRICRDYLRHLFTEKSIFEK